MQIRLILPICKNLSNNFQYKKINKSTKEVTINGKNKWYCQDAIFRYRNNKYKRFKILQNAMNYNSDNIDLVVTSNNFFQFNNYKQDFIKLKRLINNIKNKQNLLIGTDFIKSKNIHGGIPALVSYFKAFDNKKYKLETSILEVWHNEIKKNKKTFNLFSKQKRTIIVKNKELCLLSCGDILAPIHNSGVELPNSSIYIDLAHMNFSNYSINHSKGLSWIQQWKGKDKIVLVTQQLSGNNLSNEHFLKNKKYQLIYPQKIKENQKIHYFDNNHNLVEYNNSNINYILVDIDIPQKNKI